ncbi:MAG: tRNA (uridine(34)/cytosine(34)/5-carboxymethylaminomethyluridine(34)-2'-O)-methyltransferase TrmL [Clostridiales bacterium]|nr:tRNA (uridine(34)/cytosine(34)/5-carboxymethylaminomethyluridine(34)-2'-O)-methyltransferase TrmL [Clostridiales bacterium]
MPIHIVLVEPEIPQNTGNIVRTCAATGSVLHLVEPLGFKITDKYLKRAGLDYWHLLDIYVHENIDELFQKYNYKNFYFASTKAQKNYSEVKYSMDSFVFFGKETAGLNEDLLRRYYDMCIRIPMKNDARSLNLSNSVAIIVYEALRQLGYLNLV